MADNQTVGAPRGKFGAKLDRNARLLLEGVSRHRSKKKRTTNKSLQQSLLVCLFLLTIAFLLTVDEQRLLDYSSYIDYFYNSSPDYWWYIFDVKGSGPLAYSVYFTEELVWRLYTWVLGYLTSPEIAVAFTMCLISGLLFFGAQKTERPIVFFLLWICIPVGLHVTGLYQLRQGLAFAIFALFVTRDRPIAGSLLAASVHSTFVLIVPAMLLLRGNDVLGRTIKPLPRAFVPVALIVSAVAFTAIGGFAFANFGGRRVAAYDVMETTATSIFYALGMMILAAHYLLITLNTKQKNDHSYLRMTAAGGLLGSVFCAVSFFAFPLGTMRFGYLPFLFLVISLTDKTIGSVYQARYQPMATLVHMGAIAFLIYQVILAFLQGRYGMGFPG